VFTQDELNKIPPPPDPDKFRALEINQTVPLVVEGGKVDIALTLRKIENGIAYVQVTYRTGSRFRQVLSY
jgi:hypothetical protein